jgi:signal transduction histidine kinase
LVASHPHLILRIEDDGRGFEVAERQMAAVAERRLGLLGMAERVSLLGGKMEIASRPGRGTRLAIKLPAGSVEDVQGQNYSDRG